MKISKKTVLGVLLGLLPYMVLVWLTVGGMAIAQHHGGHWGGGHDGGFHHFQGVPGLFRGHGPYWGWRGVGPVPWWWGPYWLPFPYEGYCFVPGQWIQNPYTGQPQYVPGHYEPCP